MTDYQHKCCSRESWHRERAKHNTERYTTVCSLEYGEGEHRAMVFTPDGRRKVGKQDVTVAAVYANISFKSIYKVLYVIVIINHLLSQNVLTTLSLSPHMNKSKFLYL